MFGRNDFTGKALLGQIVADSAVRHPTTVATVRDNHGYPYRATCACGWQSKTYASRDAAGIMADDHRTRA